MKIAFLDLDGTLLDSRYRHIKVLKDSISYIYNSYTCKDFQILKNFLECDFSDFVQYKALGYNTLQYLENVCHINREIATKICEEWGSRIENDEYLLLDKWYENSYDFLGYLNKCGYELHIVTARRNKQYILEFINNSKLNDYVSHIEVVNPYNASNLKSEYIDGIKSAYSKCVFIGDTESDYDCAMKSKIDIYVLNSGFRSEEFWNNKKIKSYNSIEELKEVIS